MSKKIFAIALLAMAVMMAIVAMAPAVAHASGGAYKTEAVTGPYKYQAAAPAAARRGFNPISGILRHPLTSAQSCSITAQALAGMEGSIPGYGGAGEGAGLAYGAGRLGHAAGGGGQGIYYGADGYYIMGANGFGANMGAGEGSIIKLCPECGQYHKGAQDGLVTIEQSISGIIARYLETITPEPRIAFNDPQSKGRKIPILMYHAIADVPWTNNDLLFVRPAELEAQIKYLCDNGYQTITFEDFDNIGGYDKPIMLTFDDGYRDNYDILFPLLQKYNAKATVFMITNAVWDKRYLSIENLQEMAGSGLVSVQSHSMSHAEMTKLGQDKLEYELAESKEYLEEITGKPVIALCYPIGANNAAVRAAATNHYQYAVTITYGKYICGNNAISMPRIMVKRGVGVNAFASLVR